MAPRAGRRLALLGRQPEHDPLGDSLSAGHLLRGRRPGLGPSLLDRNPLRPGWCEGKAVSQRSLGGGDAGQRHCRGHEGSGNTKQRHVLTRKAVETRSKGTASARIRRSGTALPWPGRHCLWPGRQCKPRRGRKGRTLRGRACASCRAPPRTSAGCIGSPCRAARPLGNR